MEIFNQCNTNCLQPYKNRKEFLNQNLTATKLLIKQFLWFIVLLGGIFFFQVANAEEDAKSPTFFCTKCGAPHGGLFGDLCQWCAYKGKTDRQSICELERMAGNRVAWCD